MIKSKMNIHHKFSNLKAFGLRPARCGMHSTSLVCNICSRLQVFSVIGSRSPSPPSSVPEQQTSMCYFFGVHEHNHKHNQMTVEYVQNLYRIFPARLIKKVVNRYITGTHSNHCPRSSPLTTLPTFYFKLPYRFQHLVKCYCNDLDIKLVFSSFKISNLFGVKDPIPGGL